MIPVWGFPLGFRAENTRMYEEKATTMANGTRPGWTTGVVIENSGCWTIDEKMGQTYIHEDKANTLAQRDYKQPQAVIYEANRNDSGPHNSED